MTKLGENRKATIIEMIEDRNGGVNWKEKGVVM